MRMLIRFGVALAFAVSAAPALADPYDAHEGVTHDESTMTVEEDAAIEAPARGGGVARYESTMTVEEQRSSEAAEKGEDARAAFEEHSTAPSVEPDGFRPGWVYEGG